MIWSLGQVLWMLVLLSTNQLVDYIHNLVICNNILSNWCNNRVHAYSLHKKLVHWSYKLFSYIHFLHWQVQWRRRLISCSDKLVHWSNKLYIFSKNKFSEELLLLSSWFIATIDLILLEHFHHSYPDSWDENLPITPLTWSNNTPIIFTLCHHNYFDSQKHLLRALN